MENLLREYMERAFAERGIERLGGPLPVVTISREFGCPSKLIAHLLTKELNRLDGAGLTGKWRFINKEIVEGIARRLDINPSEVNYNLSAGGQGLVNDVLASFAPNYVSSHRLRRTLTSVVRSIAEQGYVVIVGRGGVGILQNNPNTIHVRLQAPREWRIEAIGQSSNLGRIEAARLVDDMDKKRTALIELMTGGKFSPYLFNISYNCSTLAIEEIVQSIIGLMKAKKMI